LQSFKINLLELINVEFLSSGLIVFVLFNSISEFEEKLIDVLNAGVNGFDFS
jgi:hypothetical protein